MVQAAGQFVPVKLNAEKPQGAALAKKYKVSGYPTILFLTAAGKVEGTIGGFMPAAPFAEELKKISTRYRELPGLEARAKANPGDGAAQAKLAGIYAAKGDEARATAALRKAEQAGNAGAALPKAYNDVADMYQMEQSFDRAIPLFRKAVETSKDPKDIAYARLSIAVCYLSQNKLKESIPELEAVTKMPDAPADMKQQATSLLSRVKGALKEQRSYRPGPPGRFFVPRIST